MKLRHQLLGLAGTLALAAATTAALSQTRGAEPWPQQGSDVPADPDVRYGTLPNGMRYALRRNQTPPGQTSMRLRIDAGSLHEQDDQRGLAHFIEHMAFNGTTHLPENEFVHRLERHGLRFGPDTNASTDFRQTVYKLDLPQSDAETIDTALYMLREVASEILFDAAAIDAERGIIQSEERTRATPPLRIAMDQIGYFLRGQRLPARWPIGNPEVISTAQRERFTAFYNSYYRPERATLVVAGDFDLDAMEAKIRAQFASWQGRGEAGRDPDLGTVAARRTEARVYVEAGGPTQANLVWLRPADLRADSRARRAERLIDQLALAVLNRRMERIAATQAPAPFIVGRAIRTEIAESADYVQLIAVSQPGEWRRALATVEAEQRRLAQHGLSAAELTREITEMRTALTAQVAGAATRQSVALSDSQVGAVDRDDVFTAPAESLRLFESAVAGLTPERVGQAARALFAGEPLLYMTSPIAVEGGDQALLAAWRESAAAPVAAPAVQQAATWPYTSFGTPGTVAERRELAEAGATAVRFANGVRLTVKRTDYADDQVLIAVRFGRGQLGLPTDRPNPAWGLAGSFQAGGLGRISFEDMQEALANRVANMTFAIDEDRFQLGGTTRPEDLGTQLQVLAAYMTDPAWRETGWNRLRSLSGTIHDQLASTPGGVFGRDAGALLRSGDRRWSTPSREEMAASSIADGRDVLQGPLGNAPIEVIVVGDVDVEAAIREAAATFGALPQRAETAEQPARIAFPAGNGEPVRLTHRGRADQGLAYIAWPTLGFFDDPRQTRALDLLAAVYQLRLIQKIREEQGTTYSPLSAHNASEAFAGYGGFLGRIEARPDALAGFLRDAQEIAADLAARPIDADELERARRPLIEGLLRQRNGNAWWLNALAGIQADPRVAATIRSQLDDYRALTPADLQRAASRFLVPARAWKLIIVPEPGAAAAPGPGAGAQLPPGAVLRPAPGSPPLPPGAVLRPRPAPAPTP